MNVVDRKDLYHLLTGLSNKLNEIADGSDDFKTADELYELVSVIDASVDQLIFSRG